VSTTHDVIIIGGGMAGASVGFELAGDRRVLLLEAEDQPGYHATGRSAAAYIPSYGFDNPALRGLTLASRSALESPDTAFHEGSFLKRRGLLTLAHSDNQASLRESYRAQSSALCGMDWVEGDYLRDALPLLREEYSVGAILEREVFDIDVHGLHESYLKGLKKRGGACATNAPVRSISRTAEGWRVDAETASYTAPVIVNAAGAWVDEAASLAGVDPIGIQPLRRTAILVETPVDTDAWPLVMESGAGFYFKPDAGLLLVSPADETPSAPCDAAPEELDVAYAAHYLEQTLDMQVRRVKHSWAGLRSFVEDHTPVIGFDSAAEGFFWLAGQGGHGIQIAPATARLAAALINGSELPAELAEQDFDPDWVSPARISSEKRIRA
jgi:D-arginine dehydrogenase